jgi:predicted enzyme related to lactoylglutathione lyase
MTVKPSETFFALPVRDMKRATRFYAEALGAVVTFASDGWSSLDIAGVRIGLFLHEGTGRSGLHFVVGDLGAARADVERAGGSFATDPMEVAPGVTIAEVEDTEGNVITLRR